MEFNDEFKNFITENLDKNEELKTFVSGLNPVTVDKVKSLVNEDKEFKSWLDSTKDQHAEKYLNTWKQNNLEKLLDEEIKKKFPEADPKDLELKKLNDKIEKMEKESLRKEYTNKAIKIATEKHLPVNLIDYFVGDTEEDTNNNLAKFEESFNKSVEALVNERLKDTSYVPNDGKGDKGNTIKDIFRKSLNS